MPFTLAASSLAVVWYARHGQPTADLAAHRARAPWYRTKQAVSLGDIHAALRRALLAARFRNGHHDQAIYDLFTDVLLTDTLLSSLSPAAYPETRGRIQ